jgi:hypothetical protein
VMVVSHGVPCTASISDLLCVPIWFLIIPDSSTKALLQLAAEPPSSKAGETWQEIAVSFAYNLSLFTLVRLFNMP